MAKLDREFLDACKNNDIVRVQELINNGANINCKGLFETPLLIASRIGSEQLVKLLLDNGANANELSYDTTPIIETILFGCKKELQGKKIKTFFSSRYYKVLDMLLDNGADVTVEDGDGKSAVCHIVEKGLVNLLGTLFIEKSKISQDKLWECANKVLENGTQAGRYKMASAFPER